MSKPAKGGQVYLLTIDPQIDFCDPKGALYVGGAEKDIDRLSVMLDKLGGRVDDIFVTLDSHQRLHVAHPEFSLDQKGNHPAPFTQITAAQVRAGEYRCANPALQGDYLSYLEKLETNGRYPYVVWPPHCLIGTPGAAVMPRFMDSLNKWAISNFGVINWVPKGSSYKTEHYSGLQADVPDPADPTTMLNKRLIEVLEKADTILFAGEAASHCVANTCADIIDNFPDPAYAGKIVLLQDAMSSVTGFDFLYDAFLAKYGQRIQLSTTTEVVKNL